MHQVDADAQDGREGELDDAIKVGPLLDRLEAVDAAQSQQTLQARKDRGDILGVEQRHGDVDEVGPPFGEIVLEHLLQDGDELRSDLGRRGHEDRQQPISESALLVIRDLGVIGIFLDRLPSSRHSILQVDGRYIGEDSRQSSCPSVTNTDEKS